MKKEMPSPPAALKRCNCLITIVMFSLEIDMGEDIPAGYVAFGLSVRSALSISGKY
jgi:hypothetical protein